MSRRLVHVAAGVLLTVAAATGGLACGSSTPDAAPPSSSTTTTAARPTSTTAGVNPAPSTAGGGASFHTTGDFCADLKTFESSSTASPAADPAAGFRTLDALKSEAPPDLQGVFDLIATAIAHLGTTDATDPAAVQRAYDALSAPEFTAGFQRLADYAKATCGVDLGATS